jgi:hypothetical protein
MCAPISTPNTGKLLLNFHRWNAFPESYPGKCNNSNFLDERPRHHNTNDHPGDPDKITRPYAKSALE